MPTYLADEHGNYTPESVRAEARLVVLSDELSPEEMTNRLGMAPDTSWRRGESNRGGRPYEHHGWELHSRLAEETAPEEHLTDLLERLAPIAETVAALATDPAVFRARLWLVRVGQNWNPGLSLSVETIRRVDVLGIGLEIDIYISGAGEHALRELGGPGQIQISH